MARSYKQSALARYKHEGMPKSFMVAYARKLQNIEAEGYRDAQDWLVFGVKYDCLTEQQLSVARSVSVLPATSLESYFVDEDRLAESWNDLVDDQLCLMELVDLFELTFMNDTEIRAYLIGFCEACIDWLAHVKATIAKRERIEVAA